MKLRLKVLPKGQNRSEQNSCGEGSPDVKVPRGLTAPYSLRTVQLETGQPKSKTQHWTSWGNRLDRNLSWKKPLSELAFLVARMVNHGRL